MGDDVHGGERAALGFFLAAQRSSVLAIIAGLDDRLLRSAIVPSGWTPLSLIEHLGDAEGAWFQHTIAGAEEPTVTLPDGVSEIDYYRDQAARSDAILAATGLHEPPAAEPAADIGIPPEIITVRDIVLHLVEETARHAGHLDIARELLDGRTGLGPR